jgi:hypothetical protein
MAASSVAPEYDEDETLAALTQAVEIEFDAQNLSMDLLGVGARFEGEAAGSGYVGEIDVSW